MARRVYRDDLVIRVLDALAGGAAVADVAATLDVPESTVRRWERELAAALRAGAQATAVADTAAAIVARQRPARDASGSRSGRGSPVAPRALDTDALRFDGRTTGPARLAPALLEAITATADPTAVLTAGAQLSVMIALDGTHAEGLEGARRTVADRIADAVARHPALPDTAPHPALVPGHWNAATHHVRAWLTAPQLVELLRTDSARARCIDRIEANYPMAPQGLTPLRTIRADLSHVEGDDLASLGDGIVWAVIDSGIAGEHPHFAPHTTLTLPDGLTHFDLTDTDVPSPLSDPVGHGTHLAGIIAGRWAAAAEQAPPLGARWQRDLLNRRTVALGPAVGVRGVAPATRLLSGKVVDAWGRTDASRVIAALDTIGAWQARAGVGRVHGVLLALGAPVQPDRWPGPAGLLAEAIERLVRNGVCVVTAAGNSGITTLAGAGATARVMQAMSIEDTGSVAGAITVGATPRDQVERLGVSRFSSGGPTVDGWPKPELVAPGERVLSAHAGYEAAAPAGSEASAAYVEWSGTSVAAAHVAGAIAALLSVRPSYVGQPAAIKALLQRTARDLGRDRSRQGAGLLDCGRLLREG